MTRRLVPSLLALALILGARSVPAADAPALPGLAETAKRYGLKLDVGPDDFPRDAAVTLLERVEKVVDSGGQHTVRVHRIVKVLREAARSLTNLRLQVPDTAQFSVTARTISPEGEVVWVQGSDVHREPVASMDALEDRAQVVSFAFPMVTPGAILEFQYSYKLESEIYADVRVLDGAYPVEVAQYVLGHPDDQVYRVFAEGSGSAALKRGRTVASTVGSRPMVLETFELRDLPAARPEPAALDELNFHPHLFVVSDRGLTSRSGDAHWERLATALARMQEGPRYGLEKLKVFARGLTVRSTGKDERVKEVLDWLARKVRLETRRNVADYPRTAEEILESGVAEPMEWSVLLAALLRGLDIPAYIAFVNSAHNLDLDRRVPWSGFFDRYVVLVPGAERALFFDPLAPDPRSGVARWDVQGRTALVARPLTVKSTAAVTTASVEFLTLPSSAPEANLDERRFRVRIGADGPATIGWEQTLRGEPAWELLDLEQDSGRKEARDAARERLADLLGDADPGRLDLTFPDKRTATVRGEVLSHAIQLTTPEGPALALGALEHWSALESLASPPPSTRTRGLDLLYPRQLRTTISAELPPSSRGVVLPPPVTLSGPGLRFEASARKTATGFERTSTLTLSDPTLAAASMPAFEEFLHGLERAWAVAVMLPPAH